MEINCFGNKYWKLPNGDLHRGNDLPAVERKSGDKEWYVNGKHHRENNKPAIEYKNGEKFWYVNGKPHRTDGAAFENASGHKLWYLEGIRYSEEEYNEKVKGYKSEGTEENNSYSQGHIDGHSGLMWL